MAKQTMQLANKEDVDKLLEILSNVNIADKETLDEIKQMVTVDGYQVPMSKCGMYYNVDATSRLYPFIIGDKLLCKKKFTEKYYDTGSSQKSVTKYSIDIADLITKKIELNVMDNITSSAPSESFFPDILYDDYGDDYEMLNSSYVDTNNIVHFIAYLKRKRMYKDGTYQETYIYPNDEELYVDSSGTPYIKEARDSSYKVIQNNNTNQPILLIYKNTRTFSSGSSSGAANYPTHIQLYYIDENDILQPLSEPISYNELYYGNTSTDHVAISPLICNCDGRYIYIIYNSMNSNHINRSILVFDTNTNTWITNITNCSSSNFYNNVMGFPASKYQFNYNNKMYILDTTGYLVEFTYDIDNDIIKFDYKYTGYNTSSCRVQFVNGALHFLGGGSADSPNNQLYPGCCLRYTNSIPYVNEAYNHFIYKLES